MPNSPFIKPCEKCKGAGTIETGWFFNKKKETCGLCNGIGHMPDRDYWETFMRDKLLEGTIKTTAVNLPMLESGITAFQAAMINFPVYNKEFLKNNYIFVHHLYYSILGEMCFAKGNILWDMGKSQGNQPILFLEAIAYFQMSLQYPENFRDYRMATSHDSRSSNMESAKLDFFYACGCSPDKQQAVESIYKRKYPNKEVPSYTRKPYDSGE
jgi:hypothetical protein